MVVVNKLHQASENQTWCNFIFAGLLWLIKRSYKLIEHLQQVCWQHATHLLTTCSKSDDKQLVASSLATWNKSVDNVADLFSTSWSKLCEGTWYQFYATNCNKPAVQQIVISLMQTCSKFGIFGCVLCHPYMLFCPHFKVCEISWLIIFILYDNCYWTMPSLHLVQILLNFSYQTDSSSVQTNSIVFII